MGILEVNNLSCRYGQFLAVREITFTVKKGEFLGIIGPNGSGKTTLLRAIDGIIQPVEGTIRLDGRSILQMDRKEIARRIAVVPEETKVVFDFTVEGIVLMGRAPWLGRFQLEGERDLEIAEHSIEATDIVHLRSRYINQLSGGEKQRVIIARALAQQTPVLLLDEPTSHLDINHQIEIFRLLKNFQKKKNLTVLCVLHDINLAALYCDRLILLKEGEIFTQGKPAEVVTSRNIKEVYQTEVSVQPGPVTGAPTVTLLPKK